MVGKTFTYTVGPSACAVFFNSKNEDLNAEEVYTKLVTPVFGKGVAYDVPNKVDFCRARDFQGYKILRIISNLIFSDNIFMNKQPTVI